MLREISLMVNPENHFQEVARASGSRIEVSECRPFNNKGMTMLLQVTGKEDEIAQAIDLLGRVDGVRRVYRGENGGESSPVLVVLDRPVICKASEDAAIVCLSCPFSSGQNPAPWRFITRSSDDLRQIMSNLGKAGVTARIEYAEEVDQKAALTTRQREIMSVAMTKGYFDFPRKISLTELSRLVGVKPSTLSEILRSAERRIMQNAVGLNPN